MASTNDPRPFGLTQPIVLREVALTGSLGAAGVASAPTISIGSGSPNGSLTRPKGSFFLRTNGSAGATAYYNTDGGTTWTTDGATATAAIAASEAKGTATVLNGNTTKVVSTSADFEGYNPIVCFGEAPTAATKVWASVVDVNGDFTITIDQDNTANLAISYFVAAR